MKRAKSLGVLWRWTAAGMLAVAAPGAQADPALPAMNSYGQPPFVPAGAEAGDGLAKTFVDLLNDALGTQPQFQLVNLPRRRLDAALGNRQIAGLALFLAPEFLPVPTQQGALWTAPVMIDENLLVSVRPLKLASLDDLHGLRLGGIAGHLYRLLAPLVLEGRIEREDAPDHVSNLHKLCYGRVDFVVISRSELAGTQPQVRCARPFLPLAFPEPQVIVRRVLVRLPGADDRERVIDAVASVACGARWREALSGYGLSNVGCRHGRPVVPGEGAARKRSAQAPGRSGRG